VQYLILETVVLTFLYLHCIVSFVLFMCHVFFFFIRQVSCPTVVMTEFVDLQNDMYVSTCVYICHFFIRKQKQKNTQIQIY